MTWTQNQRRSEGPECKFEKTSDKREIVVNVAESNRNKETQKTGMVGACSGIKIMKTPFAGWSEKVMSHAMKERINETGVYCPFLPYLLQTTQSV